MREEGGTGISGVAGNISLRMKIKIVIPTKARTIKLLSNST